MFQLIIFLSNSKLIELDRKLKLKKKAIDNITFQAQESMHRDHATNKSVNNCYCYYYFCSFVAVIWYLGSSQLYDEFDCTPTELFRSHVKF